MNVNSKGKTLYVCISDNYALRVRAMTKPKAMTLAVVYFAKQVKGWKPEHGGIFEKSNNKSVRQYLKEHTDVTWLNGGAPVDG